MAWCYKANPKSNPPKEATAAGAPCPYIFKCLNCKGEHSADNTKFLFWRHRFDKQWHSNKAAELAQVMPVTAISSTLEWATSDYV